MGRRMKQMRYGRYAPTTTVESKLDYTPTVTSPTYVATRELADDTDMTTPTNDPTED